MILGDIGKAIEAGAQGALNVSKEIEERAAGVGPVAHAHEPQQKFGLPPIPRTTGGKVIAGGGLLAAGGLTGAAILPSEAASSAGGATAASEGAAASSAASKAAEKAKSAASSAASSGITKEVLSAGLATGIAALIKAYGLRLFEVLAGGALILFGVVTLANGGKAPNLPAAIPVPV